MQRNIHDQVKPYVGEGLRCHGRAGKRSPCGTACTAFKFVEGYGRLLLIYVHRASRKRGQVGGIVPQDEKPPSGKAYNWKGERCPSENTGNTSHRGVCRDHVTRQTRLFLPNDHHFPVLPVLTCRLPHCSPRLPRLLCVGRVSSPTCLSGIMPQRAPTPECRHRSSMPSTSQPSTIASSQNEIPKPLPSCTLNPRDAERHVRADPLVYALPPPKLPKEASANHTEGLALKFSNAQDPRLRSPLCIFYSLSSRQWHWPGGPVAA